MANLPFGEWVWGWYDMQPREAQEHLETEILGDGWLQRQPAKDQVHILTGAPVEFLETIVDILKPEAVASLGLKKEQSGYFSNITLSEKARARMYKLKK